MSTPPSKLLNFNGPAAWIFDLALLSMMNPRRACSVADRVRLGRDRRLRPEQRRRLYIG